VSINWPRVIVFISAILTSSNAVTAEDLYSNQPPITPELAFLGTYDIGVSTMNIVDHSRLNTGNFITTTSRPVVLEVWYPADMSRRLSDDTLKASYKNVTRRQQPFELQGLAYRDIAPATYGQFPIVLLSHGLAGLRLNTLITKIIHRSFP
jgi:hypothetical protein